MFIPTYNKDTGTGTGAGMIAGDMKTHLDKENEKDLCVLAPPVERDRLTRLLEGRLSYFFRVGTRSLVYHGFIESWLKHRVDQR
jgi:hypothetical protein